MDDIRALLDNHFPQFEDALVDRIASVATLRTFARDEVMMYSGRYFKSTILIVGGRVKLYRESNDGKEYFMYYIEPGNACALSMICAARNQASEITAVAVEDTQVIQVPLEIMDDLMREYKSW
ncbi:MAG TPA: cyclic nucleotide-binding domain-containing protein, partial [Chitinophagales bacterium]|nr:cyclic nucleotide-binding domain-containing protein [Chitinophagales bacterium]HNO29421.1 cyclic nucleotide-binding domain-containing protein [Chitinophagales bacterium]